MESFGWTVNLRPGTVEAYVEAHTRVWPEMCEAIQSAGFRASRMFVADNAVFGYTEAEIVAEAQKVLGATAVNRRWQEHMAGYFEPGSGPRPLNLIFALD